MADSKSIFDGIDFSPTLKMADNAASVYLEKVFKPLAAAMADPIYYLAVIYITVLAFQAYRGQFPLNDFVRRIIFLAFIFSVVTWSGLGGKLLGICTGFMDEAGGVILSGQEKTETVLDGFYKGVLRISQAIQKDATWMSPGQIATAQLLMLVDIVMFGCALAIMAMAKLGLAIVLSLCPIFMAFLIFPATRQWGYNWINLLLFFIFWYLLTVCILSLGFSTFEDYVTTVKMLGVGGGNTKELLNQYITNNTKIATVFLVMFVQILFLFQVKTWASVLTGGAMAHGGGAIRAIIMVAKKALTKGVA